MSVPDYQSLMLPLLRLANAANRPVGVLDVLPAVAAELKLGPEDLAERLPSGRQGVLHNRLQWAKHYLTNAGLLESTKRGQFQVTGSGNTVGPNDINSFIGALNVKKANKGLFVTASSFTKQALEHAAASSLHVVLMDGDRLAALMVRHNVGVVVRETIEIKAIDEGFFSD